MVLLRKSQVSFEFAVTLFIVITITSIFGLIAADRLLDVRNEQNNLRLEGVAITVKNEIDIAHAMESGYIRSFALPDRIGNRNYSITIQDNYISVLSEDLEYVLAVQPIDGTVKKGVNVIEKTDIVVLNG